MSTLIIPDPHEQIALLTKLVAAHDGLVIVLGDLFDAWESTPESRAATIEYVATRSADPRLTHLWGNHDLQYAFPGVRALRCSGWNSDTQARVDAQLTWEDHWRHWKLSTMVGKWHVSHAGAARRVYLSPMRQQDALTSLRIKSMPEMLEAGWARGGRAPIGGLTWLDWEREFSPLPGVRQIVGHSEGPSPRWRGENLCLDTSLAHVALVHDDKVRVMTTDAFLSADPDMMTVGGPRDGI